MIVVVNLLITLILDILHDPRKRLITLLWLITAHSASVGTSLIAFALFWPEGFRYFGYHGYQGIFFMMQGGVFHFVIALVYAYGATHIDSVKPFIILTITAKCIAVVFLFSYYFLLEHIWMVLFSGIFDGLMAIAVWLSYRSIPNSQGPELSEIEA